MHVSMCTHTRAQTSRRVHAEYAGFAVTPQLAFYWSKRSLMIHLSYFSVDRQKCWYNHVLSLSGKGHRHHGDPVKKNIATWVSLVSTAQCVNNFSVHNCCWKTVRLTITYRSLFICRTFCCYKYSATPPQWSFWVPSCVVCVPLLIQGV